MCFDNLPNKFDSLSIREFDFIKTTFGATICNFDLTSPALVLIFSPSHLISYELDLASYEFDFILTSHEFDWTSDEFVLTSGKFGLTNQEFDVTSDDFELTIV